MAGRYFESLENRQLFAGVTIIAPTWDSNIGGYVLSSENNITARLGGSNQVPEYTLTIAPNANGTLAVQGISHDDRTARLTESPDQQVVLTIDYRSVSTNPSYPLWQTAGLVANYMETTPVDGTLLASLPIHEIGVSRSSGLMDELAKALGKSGIWVDQETYNDPHPIGAIGDAPNTIYDNVAFADNYWRTADTPEHDIYYNSHSVNGAYNLELPFVQADSAGYGTPHEAPAGWYNATIDLNSTNELIGPVHDDWWGTTPDHPPRDQTGFYYTSIIGGDRPLSGVWSASGGTGVRTATGESGQQWANITDVASTNGNTFASGQPIDISFIHQDRDDNSTATFYLDPDQNAVNNNEAALGSADFNASSTIDQGQFTGSTANVAPGTYWLAAKIVDGQGHVRYSYGKQITITAAPPVTVATPAQADSSDITGTSTGLSILGGGTAGESNLTYEWSILSKPDGVDDPTFSVNDSNGAKTTKVSFTHAGTYQFRCTISDALGDSVTSDTTVTVEQAAHSLGITTQHLKLHRKHKTVLHTTVLDQFGQPMVTQPASLVQYSLQKGPGSVTPNSGVFKASNHAGRVVIGVDEDGLSTNVGLTVL